MTRTHTSTNSVFDPILARLRGWCWLEISSGIAWCALAGLGWSILLSHTYQPGSTGDAVAQWPAAASSSPPGTDFRVIVFAHPFCPCTRATLHELDESLPRLSRKVSISVIFVTAGLAGADVARSDTVAFARRLRGVEVRFDEDGQEARLFGAAISGEAFAFAPHGRRLFHGGLTPGRGHQGDAAGQRKLEQILNGLVDESCQAPVFGCPLPTNGLAPHPNRSPRSETQLPSTANADI